MSKSVLVALSALMAFVYSDHALAETRGNCPVTLGTDRFLGPPFPESENWYGSEGLAVMVPGNRAWGTTGANALIAVKLFWWAGLGDFFGSFGEISSFYRNHVRNIRDS